MTSARSFFYLLTALCLAAFSVGAAEETAITGEIPATETAPILRYDFDSLIDAGGYGTAGASDKAGATCVSSYGELESVDVFTAPSAIRLDCSKYPERGVVAAHFQLTGERLVTFKGKPLKFGIQIKRKKGSGEIALQLRCWGKKGLVTATARKPLPGTAETWQALSLSCMIPAGDEVTRVDFVIWVSNNAENPQIALVDAPVLVVTEQAPAAVCEPTFATYVRDDKETPLELVRDGVPQAVIVVPDKATSVVAYAVKELNEHLRLCTGAELPVVKDGDPVTGAVIHVGKTALTTRLGLAPEFLAPDNWVVRRAGQALILSGGDNRQDISPEGYDALPFGTLYATYEFLERALGIRWYWPGTLGRVTPQKTSLALGNICWQGAPSYDARLEWCARRIIDPDIDIKDAVIWWRRMRRGALGGYPIANHSFGGWNKRFGKEHPEWFALQRNGTRLSSDAPASGSELGHLCWTNPEVLSEAIREKRNQFDEQPWRKYREVMPGDGDQGLQCQCENCRALFLSDDSLGEMGGFVGGSRKHSRVVWSFVNQVAAAVRKTHPEKIITCCAYGGYSIPPSAADVQFESNVAITLCDDTFPARLWDPDLKDRYRRRFDEWSPKSANLYVWDYWLWRHSKGTYGSPAIFPRAIQEWFLLDRGWARGHAIELEDVASDGQSAHGWADWMFDIVNVYVAYRLMWNLDQDVDAILEEYYRDFYGPIAGPHMKKFYDAMEAAYADPSTKGDPDFRWDWETCWVRTYSPEFVKRVMDELRTAEAASRGSEPYHARAEKTLRGFLPFEEASQRWTTALTKSIGNSALVPPMFMTAPVIDGKLDDESWRGGAVGGSFVDSFNGENLHAKTEIRLARDANTLYLAVRAELPQGIAKRALPAGSIDGNVWDNESCEFFFVNGDKKYQFLLGIDDIYADNRQLDRLRDQKLDFQWNCPGVRYKTARAEKEWTAELVIPLASLELPEPTREQPWRINFTRNHFYVAADPAQEPRQWQQELSTWRPTFGSFHNVDRYGVLFFENAH
jgi:hypothetical protein